MFAVPPGLALALAMLFPVNMLTNVDDSAAWFGRLSVVVTLALPIILMFLHLGAGIRISRRLAWPLACFAVLCLLYIPRETGGDRDWILLAQVFLLTGYFAATASWNWTSQSLNVLGKVAQAWLLLAACGWLWHERPIPYAGWYENANANGAMLAHVFGFAMFSARFNRSVAGRLALFVFAGSVISLIGLTASRAAVLAAVAGSGIYIVWPYLCRRRRLFIATFGVTLGAIIVAIIVETVLAGFVHEQGYGDLAFELTGKNLGTRTKIWEISTGAILERPLLGHGGGTDTSELLGQELSSHSLYLQITLQVGLVGLAVLIAILYSIWTIFWLGRHDPIVRIAGAALIAALVHQVFEVSLTQNNLAVGAMTWLIVAIGVSRSINSGHRPSSMRGISITGMRRGRVTLASPLLAAFRCIMPWRYIGSCE